MLDPTRNYAPKAGKERFQKNLDAIKLMRELETAGRHATAEEKERLLAYTGWGWMKEAFNSVRATKWANKQVRVRAEYDRAKAYFDREQSSSYGRYASDPGTWEDYVERLVTDPEDTTDSKLGSWVKNYLPSYERLRAELTEAEFTSAAKSVRNAHFTDVPVIGAMWKLVRRLGFKGGNALEPGAGIGHFIGTQPGDLADRTRWNAVELDSVTARILAHLYPEATVNGEPSKAGRAVEGQGFQEARVPNNSQDLVISNVPFDATGPGQSQREFGRQTRRPRSMPPSQNQHRLCAATGSSFFRRRNRQPRRRLYHPHSTPARSRRTTRRQLRRGVLAMTLSFRLLRVRLRRPAFCGSRESAAPGAD